jgi:hypothetical protein
MEQASTDGRRPPLLHSDDAGAVDAHYRTKEAILKNDHTSPTSPIHGPP